MTRFTTHALIFLLSSLPGLTHAFENSATLKVTPVLKATTSWDGTPINYPAGPAEITGLIIEIPPGAQTGWHEHPVVSFGIVLEGELEVRLQNGNTIRLRAGEALAEVVNTLHNGTAIGEKPVKLVVFYTGTIGIPLTIKHPEIK